ncbi:RDD family protein [Epilithonimonas hungarica]|uniref:RDD family protein n=1 Tax=Epilithonimonas hungarica TaxID=454006 RepID=UPI003521B917
MLGTTFGKSFFKIRVIDDYAKYPSLKKSFIRNVLCLINLFPTFTDVTNKKGVAIMRMNFNMYLNNKICKTYVVKTNNIIKLQDILNQGIEIIKSSIQL